MSLQVTEIAAAHLGRQLAQNEQAQGILWRQTAGCSGYIHR